MNGKLMRKSPLLYVYEMGKRPELFDRKGSEIQCAGSRKADIQRMRSRRQCDRCFKCYPIRTRRNFDRRGVKAIPVRSEAQRSLAGSAHRDGQLCFTAAKREILEPAPCAVTEVCDILVAVFLSIVSALRKNTEAGIRLSFLFMRTRSTMPLLLHRMLAVVFALQLGFQ